MTKTFAKVIRRPEFEKDIKKLLKRYRSLEEDLSIFINTQLHLFHYFAKDNKGIARIDHLGIDHPKIYKAVKFACKSFPGRGAASGIRVVYAFFEDSNHIEFVQIYFKGDAETEDRDRIRSLYSK